MNNSKDGKHYKIVNIVTCYSNEEEVLTYAKSLSEQLEVSKLCLVVVMNKSGEMEIEKFKSKISQIKIDSLVYTPDSNLGYLNGLIYGYRSYVMDNKAPDWVVMSNTDIKFNNNTFFEKFLSTEYDSNIWCVGPSIFSPETSSYENPQYSTRHTLESLDRRIFIFEREKLAYYYLKLAALKSKIKKSKKMESQNVYSVHGCFFIIRKEMAEMLKNKEYGVLMYSEEAYLAELIRINQKKCFYDSNIEVIHEGSTVTGKLMIKNKARYFADSLKYIRKEFYY